MITIRAEQLRAMAAARAREREPRMLDHARDCFPHESAAMTAGELRAFVRHAIAKAGEHGIEGVAGACRYLNLMFLFGRDFDVDPALGWPREVLDRADPAASTIDRLVAAARAALGPEGDEE